MAPMLRRAALTLVLLVGGCTGDAPDAAAPSPAAAPPPSGAPAAPCPTGAGHPAGGERAGSGGVWALFFPTGDALRAGAELKIVWRLPGAGEPLLRATGPAGATVEPRWGPTWHSDSTWDRPGDEWGTGWVFPAAGCWTVTVRRSGTDVGALAISLT